MRKKLKNPRFGDKSSRSPSKRDTISTSREDAVPFIVLGLSVGALALSVYAVTGGPVDDYLASRQPYVAHAENQIEQPATTAADSSDINEILGKGSYDITVKIDEDGERSYVLTPIQSDETDEDVTTTVEDTVEDEPSSTDDAETTNATTDGEADSTESSDSNDDSDLSSEAQEKLEEHKSMRLRMKPDRDGSDIYYYVVEPGDTLAEISAYFNIPLGQLMEDNHIENSDMIYVGEVIFMPTGFTK